MDPLKIGTAILKLVNTLLGLRDSLAKEAAARRGSMADFFDGMAERLRSTSADVRAGKVTIERCAELGIYISSLPERMKGVVLSTEAEEIILALKQAHAARALLAARDQTGGGPELDAIDEAAGKVQALGNLLRI
jgi:hypothetical protein